MSNTNSFTSLRGFEGKRYIDCEKRHSEASTRIILHFRQKGRELTPDQNTKRNRLSRVVFITTWLRVGPGILQNERRQGKPWDNDDTRALVRVNHLPLVDLPRLGSVKWTQTGRVWSAVGRLVFTQFCLVGCSRLGGWIEHGLVCTNSLGSTLDF